MTGIGLTNSEVNFLSACVKQLGGLPDQHLIETGILMKVSSDTLDILTTMMLIRQGRSTEDVRSEVVEIAQYYLKWQEYINQRCAEIDKERGS